MHSERGNKMKVTRNGRVKYGEMRKKCRFAIDLTGSIHQEDFCPISLCHFLQVSRDSCVFMRPSIQGFYQHRFLRRSNIIRSIKRREMGENISLFAGEVVSGNT